MKRFIVPFFFLLSLSKAQQSTEFTDLADRTKCIPLSDLRDSMIERGLGEARVIRKVHLYFIGSGHVDVTVGIATRYVREDFRKPILMKCGEYQGSADNIMVSISCAQEGDDTDRGALSGYAVYAKFNGDLVNQSVSVCQMDIFLQARDASEKSEKMQTLAKAFATFFFLLALIAAGIIIWFFWMRYKKNEEQNSHVTELSQTCSKSNVSVRSSHKSQPHDATVDLTYGDDEVFLK